MSPQIWCVITEKSRFANRNPHTIYEEFLMPIEFSPPFIYEKAMNCPSSSVPALYSVLCTELVRPCVLSPRCPSL